MSTDDSERGGRPSSQVPMPGILVTTALKVRREMHTRLDRARAERKCRRRRWTFSCKSRDGLDSFSHSSHMARVASDHSSHLRPEFELKDASSKVPEQA